MTTGAYFHRIEALAKAARARDYITMWAIDEKHRLDAEQPRNMAYLLLAAAIGHVTLAQSYQHLADRKPVDAGHGLHTPQQAADLLKRIETAIEALPVPSIGEGSGERGERPSDAAQAAEYDAAVATMAAPHLRGR